ncbi:hypothetical protein H8B06_05890 [Sphingobacterium sp. DN00404]|uniref:Uncharacterized protein n=1 Tax=Sphingobacterium micropteri TaxID=2763501 RepID=A0ABR7YM02_9SPHI|nr:hypothetical protein [Sphingobacterium micropteri]MBD1432348.1 hypothetical protein [Sphingobacterium micropteri]
MDEKFITEIRGMFESLHERMRQNLPFWENEVDIIIANQETDRNKIELTFDYLLDYTRHGIGNEVYLRLIGYYRTVDPEGAAYYLQIYQEQEDEENV